MAVGRRLGNDRVAPWADVSKTGGQVIENGPYIGVIKNNLDPTRSGRLQVYITDLGGSEDEVQNWRTVSYASPFFGSTFQPEATEVTAHDTVHHNYGMWMVPPDIGNEVLCIFVNGDPGRGYWFACVDKHLSHNGLPANNSHFGPQEQGTVVSALTKASIGLGRKQPSGEFNENKEGNIGPSYLTNPKSVHEYQAEVLINQGLDGDLGKGPISSSSQRETPSNVFGISTPGRPTADPTLAPDYLKRLNEGKLTEEDYAVRQRRGGHSFIMDDGDLSGNDQLLRLRSSAGHQILMSDDAKLINIINGNGSVWLEMTGDGHLMMYSYGGMHIRTEGEMNFHADSNINMHTKKNFNVHADGDIALDSQASLTLKSNVSMTQYSGQISVGSGGNITTSAAAKVDTTAGGNINLFTPKELHLNTASGPIVPDPGNLKKFYHADVNRDSLATPWTSVPKGNISIASIVPAHEPWARQTGEAMTDTGFVVGQVLTAASATRETNTATTFAEVGGTIAGGNGPTTSVAQTNTTSAASSGTASPVGDSNSSGKPPTGKPPATGNSTDSGPATAENQSIQGGITGRDLSSKDAPPTTIGVANLSPEQTQALKAQISKSESGGAYDAVNQLNYLGRYQVGGAVLQDQGLLRPEYVKKYGNKAALHPEAWTAKAHSLGIRSQGDFLANGAVQEKVMDTLLVSNAKTLKRIGALQSGDSPATSGGMLQTAHLLGAGGAKKWRNGGGGSDANGTTGIAYFNKGRHAVEQVATA